MFLEQIISTILVFVKHLHTALYITQLSITFPVYSFNYKTIKVKTLLIFFNILNLLFKLICCLHKKTNATKIISRTYFLFL